MIRSSTVRLLLNMAAAAQFLASDPSMLKIVIVEGEGAINNIRQRVAREPVVAIEDEARRPVAGAEVVFRLPDTDPAGPFRAERVPSLSPLMPTAGPSPLDCVRTM